MSHRRSCWQRLATKLFGPASGLHRRHSRSSRVEALESRQYLSASMTLLNDGHTLSVVGDDGNNSIAIVQDERGVQVTADGDPTRSFAGIDVILVQTGLGNDDVRVIYGFNPQPDPPADPWTAPDLRVSLGAGDDKFTLDLQFPPDPCRIGVDAGSGNDVVSLRTLIDPNDRSLVDPNDRPESNGDLLLYANLGDGSDVFSGDLQFPPDPCRLVVSGGGGADSINALIGLLSNATPAGDAQGTIDVSLNGGDGNDNIQSAARNVNLNSTTTIELLGGAGNDIVQQTFEMVTVNAGLLLNANGGAGDDYVVLSASPTTRPTEVTPTFFANSQVQLSLQGDTGNDRLIGLIQPCILPAGSVDLVFSGGGGNDWFYLLLGLEPGELNPPSDSEPAREHDGPLRVAVLGGDGDDQLNLSVLNLGHSESPLDVRLDGGAGRDTAVATPGIDARGWTA